MEKEVIHSAKAPAAVGPYSHAIKSGNMVFTSGQIPLDPKTGQVVDGGIQAQTRQALDNLREVLIAAGAGLGNVVKTTCFLDDMNDFAQFNAVYAEFFKEDPPARSCVAVDRLPRNVLVEVEAVAVIG
jgi:2-iminobutanoate/2-iminopropanoate deaminase